MALLEVNNISKSYSRKKVLNGVSFSLDAGQVLGLTGPNGAGKSTCVSILATLLQPDKGEILFEGHDIAKEPNRIRSAMGYVPQDIALYETLTGYDNLKFWGKSYGVPAGQLKDEIKRVSAYIGLDDSVLKRRVSEYSGGMKRRLNIGVALLHRPKLLLLDEPTAGVDVSSGSEIMKAIKQLSEEGTAVIFVGHDMRELEQIGARICVLDEGEVKEGSFSGKV